MSLPTEPYSRIERYLAKIAGQDVDIPDKPITRIECYLDYIVGNGGGVPAANAGARNAAFRGESLGSSFTTAQADAIDSGTFSGMYLGDYWEFPWGDGETPPLVKFRIAGFDTYFKVATATFDKHHVVVVPDTALAEDVINTTATVEGGYKGSYLKTTVLPDILTDLEELFGSGNILERVSYLNNGSSVEATATKIDLLTITQFTGMRYASSWGLMGEMITQLPLFMADSRFTRSETPCWTQDFYSTSVMTMHTNGTIGVTYVTTPRGVRPYFCLGKGT